MKAFTQSPSAMALCLILGLASCSTRHGSETAAGNARLSGRGYVHYHPYPAVGQCYCGVEYDFAAHDMMVAAATETIHHYYSDSLCSNRKYAWLTARDTGKRIRVLIVDKGGQPTDDFNRSEQHIMDISEAAFSLLDTDGKGLHAGRIYVDWEIVPVQ
jgi:hypothetical protein